jgi:hypothetical protein
MPPRNEIAQAAFEAGKTRYFDGLKCIHGHVAERMVANSSCVECMHIRQKGKYRKVKAWRKENPGKVAEQRKRYAAKHPETHQKAAKKYKESHLEELRTSARDFKRRRRISEDPSVQKRRSDENRQKRHAKLEVIAGRPRPELCELCGGKSRTQHSLICFDHCHKSGKFRGWLCDRCNKVLGLVEDSPGLLSAMCSYVLNGGVSEKEKHG